MTNNAESLARANATRLRNQCPDRRVFNNKTTQKKQAQIAAKSRISDSDFALEFEIEDVIARAQQEVDNAARISGLHPKTIRTRIRYENFLTSHTTLSGAPLSIDHHQPLSRHNIGTSQMTDDLYEIHAKRNGVWDEPPISVVGSQAACTTTRMLAKTFPGGWDHTQSVNIGWQRPFNRDHFAQFPDIIVTAEIRRTTPPRLVAMPEELRAHIAHRITEARHET